MPRLSLPPAVITQDPEPLHQHRRLAMLRRVLNDDSLPMRARVAAALVLLYAQPVSRIVRLTIDDVTDDETTVTVQLGDPPSPLPEPVADLMRAYRAPSAATSLRGIGSAHALRARAASRAATMHGASSRPKAATDRRAHPGEEALGGRCSTARPPVSTRTTPRQR
jgi:integrase